MAWKNVSILRAIPARRPVSALLDPGYPLSPPQGHRASCAPLSSTGRRLRGPGEPRHPPAEMLFASPLQAPFPGHISPGFSPRFCDQTEQVIARWSPAPIPELPGTSRNFPHRGLRRTAPTARFKLLFSVSGMFPLHPRLSPSCPETRSSQNERVSDGNPKALNFGGI